MTAQAASAAEILARIADTLETRLPQNGGDPQPLFRQAAGQGPDAFLKIGEEATELVAAARTACRTIVSETADLWFHCLVALTHFRLRPEDVLAELARREGLSGLVEKASRPQD